MKIDGKVAESHHTKIATRNHLTQKCWRYVLALIHGNPDTWTVQIGRMSVEVLIFENPRIEFIFSNKSKREHT